MMCPVCKYQRFRAEDKLNEVGDKNFEIINIDYSPSLKKYIFICPECKAVRGE